MFEGLASEIGDTAASPALRLRESSHHAVGRHAGAVGASRVGVHLTDSARRKSCAEWVRSNGVDVVAVTILQRLLVSDRCHGHAVPRILGTVHGVEVLKFPTGIQTQLRK